MCFADGDVFMIGSDGNHGIGLASHVTDTLKVAFELLAFAVESGKFLLGHALVFRSLLNGFKVGEAFDALADGGHVGEHAAQPAVVDVVLSGSFSSFADGFLSLALAADEENLAVASGEVGEESGGLVEALFSFFEVDQVDASFVLQEGLLHAGVPLAGLVSVVNAGFYHLVDQIINHMCMLFFLKQGDAMFVGDPAALFPRSPLL